MLTENHEVEGFTAFSDEIYKYKLGILKPLKVNLGTCYP